MIENIITKTNDAVKMVCGAYQYATYHRKHCRRIDWDSTMTDSARLGAACVAGLMLGAAMFCAFLM